MAVISIIVPIYNKERYLKSCLESILNQTFSDFELILINDGSKDKSGIICDRFQELDRRVKVIHQRNSGVSSARNTGLEVANGEFIGFVDADDLLEPDMFATLLENCFQYGADISMCGIKRILPHKEEVYGKDNKIRLYTRDEGLSALLNGDILLSCYDKIFKAAIVKDVRFVAASYFEDMFYNFEAIKNSSLLVFDNTPKYNYIIRDNSQSMAVFSSKYMDIITISERVLLNCKNELPNHVEEAKNFDFNSNMFILNLILLSSKDKFANEYNKVVSNLEMYSHFYKNPKEIKRKYKVGYFIFQISPWFYCLILHCYTYFSKSENTQRRTFQKKRAQAEFV